VDSLDKWVDSVEWDHHKVVMVDLMVHKEEMAVETQVHNLQLNNNNKLSFVQNWTLFAKPLEELFQL